MMPFEEAERLFFEIRDFLISCGGDYSDFGRFDEDLHILTCLAANQYLWEPNRYFVCWWMLDKNDMQLVKQHRLPGSITTGSNMWILECGCKQGMRELVRSIRKHGKQGVHWHRANKGMRDFPHQKGA